MKRPITPNRREPIRAEHMRSHAEAIQWLYERVKNIKTRNGIGEDSIAASSYVPWKPNFFQEGTEESPIYKARFNLGTVNNVPSTNWNDEFMLPSTPDTFNFVIITITTTSGKVSGVTISVDVAPPTEDVISADTPPTTFKIVLGAIGSTTAKMIVNRNLQVIAGEVFRATKTAPAVGAESFTRWWRWNYTQI